MCLFPSLIFTLKEVEGLIIVCPHLVRDVGPHQQHHPHPGISLPHQELPQAGSTELPLLAALCNGGGESGARWGVLGEVFTQKVMIVCPE